MMRGSRLSVLPAAVLAGLPAWSDGTAADLAGGAALFERYCSTCHGTSLRGDGPMAATVPMPPADLTALAAGNGGVFPFRDAVRRIDGRDVLVAHGSPMPTYGAFFEGSDTVTVDTEMGAVEVSPPVLAVVRYIESMQRPDPAAPSVTKQ